MHSAHWDESYALEGKKVAVIGVGSSGIQILPQVAKRWYRLELLPQGETDD